MVMNLVREFAETVEQIDLIVIRNAGPHFDNIPNNVSVIQLRAKHTITAIPELVRYFKTVSPEALLVAKDRAARAALMARQLAGVNTRIVVRLGTNLSAALKHRSALSSWIRRSPMRLLYKKADAIVAVSQGVANDTILITNVAPERVHVIKNPVITNEFLQSATHPVNHPWFEEKIPIIMGVGRLSMQKDFDTLIKAFALINTNARLMILGDGKARAQLQALIKQHGLEDRVALQGFTSPVAAWLSKASLFVLSSRWEGSPNALSEALALGIPSVSTRCPSGPNEVLCEGQYGPLVEVGDVENMARSIDEVLSNPLPADELQKAVSEYNVELSAQRYLRLLEVER